MDGWCGAGCGIRSILDFSWELSDFAEGSGLREGIDRPLPSTLYPLPSILYPRNNTLIRQPIIIWVDLRRFGGRIELLLPLLDKGLG